MKVRIFLRLIVLSLFLFIISGCNSAPEVDLGVVTEYKIIFQDWDQTVILETSVERGANAVPPANPNREGHTFVKWDHSLSNIQKNTTITAIYEEVKSKYNIVWKDEENDILNTTQVNEEKFQTISTLKKIQQSGSTYLKVGQLSQMEQL